MSQPIDYYNVLGVEETADADAIKKAYRKLARTHHPDRNPDDPKAEDRFKEVQEAYGVLSDAKKRQQYDRLRRNPFAGGMPGGMPGGGGGFQQGQPGDMSDLFEQFFGGGAGMGGAGMGGRRAGGFQAPPREHRPEDLDDKRTVKLSFERMMKGGEATFSVDGERIRVPFPPGVKDGYRVRIRARGKTVGPRTGDLYVTFRTSDEGRFRRDGLNVHTTLDVHAIDAMTGTTATVQAPGGGTLKLTIPSGTQQGEKLRIRGQGIPDDDGKGDLLVEVHITIPTTLTDAQKDALRQIKG